MNNHTLLYIVTDLTAKGGHITMTGPEQFIHWIKTEIIHYNNGEIIHYNKGDLQILYLADLLIGYLNRQIAGEATHQLVISTAKELDLRVTVIAGTIIADWNE